MKLLCFQAKHFRWKTHSKTLPDVVDQNVDTSVDETVVVFLHVEAGDGDVEKFRSVQRQALKHIKWLANKRGLKNIVLHSFTHLGAAAADPGSAEMIIATLAQRLGTTGHQVWTTPFGYFCEWELSVYGESLAKVWKEIR
jgi:hypothetical protein